MIGISPAIKDFDYMKRKMAALVPTSVDDESLLV
jgi:hypothetical protein